MSAPAALAERHTWWRATIFQLKVWGLTGGRQLRNLRAPLPRCRVGTALAAAPVAAESASDLWHPDDTPSTWPLTAGKVENLRRAVRRLHGLEVPAGATFSFWRHVGRPSAGRGYVPGREIREGCVLPTVAGGLCQLTNALYDAALLAGFTIVERHRHSRVLPGSLAERNRDATVKWNYLDLRFRAAHPFRIEAELTADRLLVRLRAVHPAPPAGQAGSGGVGADWPLPLPAAAAPGLHDCLSCGNVECFRHAGRGRASAPPALTHTSYLLDECWPELLDYVRATARPADAVLVPWPARAPALASRYRWPGLPGTRALPLAATWRELQLRLAARRGRNLFAAGLALDARVARAAARHLAPGSTHLVVAQALLPQLWQAGVLGGRTYDVLLTRLPAQHLHERLDQLHARHPASATAADFRADPAWVAAETQALAGARRIITPHHELAGLFRHKAVLLDWQPPRLPAARRHTTGADPLTRPVVLFPASAVARKGAYEMRQLAQELGLPLLTTGRATEQAGFWQGVAVGPAGPDSLAGAAVVVLPAYVEHQPRLLLRALAAGVPVVATPACGLPPQAGLTLVPAGNYPALRAAVQQVLASASGQ